MQILQGVEDAPYLHLWALGWRSISLFTTDVSTSLRLFSNTVGDVTEDALAEWEKMLAKSRLPHVGASIWPVNGIDVGLKKTARYSAAEVVKDKAVFNAVISSQER